MVASLHKMRRLYHELVSGRYANKNQENGAYPEKSMAVIVESEGGPVALAVDELIGRQQVLVRPLQGRLADVQDASGCALLGGGEVGMVLDLGAVEMN